jgi:hypothetical protein
MKEKESAHFARNDGEAGGGGLESRRGHDASRLPSFLRASGMTACGDRLGAVKGGTTCRAPTGKWGGRLSDFWVGMMLPGSFAALRMTTMWRGRQGREG